MTWELLFGLLAPGGRLGSQLQGDVGGLHSVSDHPYEVAAQRVEVRLVPELGREGRKRLGRVVGSPKRLQIPSETSDMSSLIHPISEYLSSLTA
jgi:hypothetical protein